MIEVSSQEHTSAIEIGYRNLLTPGVLPPHDPAILARDYA
jgi:hypothetical protein